MIRSACLARGKGSPRAGGFRVMHFPNRLPIFLTAACISFNLSFSGSAFGQPLTCADLDGAQVYGAESFRYLGFFGSASAEDSIMNPNTGLGSPNSFNGSVRAEGVYGGQCSARSARNTAAMGSIGERRS